MTVALTTGGLVCQGSPATALATQGLICLPPLGIVKQQQVIAIITSLDLAGRANFTVPTAYFASVQGASAPSTGIKDMVSSGTILNVPESQSKIEEC